jgi:hypothetical protein
LTVQFNSTKEKKEFSNFLDNVKLNYGLTSDADALLVLESTIDWLSMDKSNSLVLGKKIFCSDFGMVFHSRRQL